MKSDGDEFPSNHPNINREDVHLRHDPDSGLRFRKPVASLLKSSIIKPAIPSNSKAENIDIVSATSSPSEILETLKDDSSLSAIESRSFVFLTLLLMLYATMNKLKEIEISSFKLLKWCVLGLTVICGGGLLIDTTINYPKLKRSRKIKVLFIFLFPLFACLTFVLILSPYTDKEVWNLVLLYCCYLGLAIFSGRLLKWFLVLWDENHFLVEKYELGKYASSQHYFYSFLKSPRGCIWLCLNVVTWSFLITRSKYTTKVLNYITRGIVPTSFVATAWMLKTIAMKRLYASFCDKRFSKRILESRFHQYMLQTLSGPPCKELSEVIHSSRLVSSSGSNVIDLLKPQRIKRRMIEIASQADFYKLPNRLGKLKDMMTPDEQCSRNTTTEWEAKVAAALIFENVATPGYKYIEEEDLLCFMTKEEVDMVLPLIGGKEENGRINEKSFLKWVVSMYMKSKFLEHSINDIAEVITALRKYVNVLLIVVLINLWVLVMRIATIKVLLVAQLCQILLAVFTICGCSLKSTYEGMIFVLKKHPFDVGDRCVIDGVQGVIEKVSILTTVILGHDNKKMNLLNSTLDTKSIINFNRSPEMRDTVEFDMDFSASVVNVSALKAKIKTYIDSNPHLWKPEHSVLIREIEDVHKMKMRLYVTHTINFQDYEEISDRRSDLVLELGNIFHQLRIKYHIHPPKSCD